MRMTTLTRTRTKTVTTTKMLTACLALALANASALAVLPLEETAIMNVGVQCPVEQVDFKNVCNDGKFRSVEVTCGNLDTPLFIENKEGDCLTTTQLQKQAALACQEECIAEAKIAE